MGLDITAYRQLEKLTGVTSVDGVPTGPNGEEFDDYDLHAYTNSDFPGRNGSIEDRAFYKASGSMGFRAGSYSGYNAWRDELAKIAGYPSVALNEYGVTRYSHAAGAWAESSGPFWEMINFSDCEGTIGPEISRKLAEDFAAFDEKAKASEIGWFYETYQKWREAFEMASDAGAVDFH